MPTPPCKALAGPPEGILVIVRNGYEFYTLPVMIGAAV